MKSIGRSFLIGVIRCVLLPFVLNSPSKAQWYVNSSSYNKAPFQAGEQLQFKVKWGFIRLGTVRFVQRKASCNDSILFRLASQAKSAAGIPFVDVNLANTALIDSRFPRNIDFFFKDMRTSTSEAFYSYDSSSHTALMKGIDNGRDTVTVIAEADEGCYDPLGFLMLLRCLSGCGYNVVVPMMLGYKLQETHICFHSDIEPVKIDMWDETIAARRFELKANWTDPHSGGMKGDITGWISADDAAVPLRFDIEILLGSVRVELESCSRPGWIIPGAALASKLRQARQEGNK